MVCYALDIAVVSTISLRSELSFCLIVNLEPCTFVLEQDQDT